MYTNGNRFVTPFRRRHFGDQVPEISKSSPRKCLNSEQCRYKHSVVITTRFVPTSKRLQITSSQFLTTWHICHKNIICSNRIRPLLNLKYLMHILLNIYNSWVCIEKINLNPNMNDITLKTIEWHDARSEKFHKILNKNSGGGGRTYCMWWNVTPCIWIFGGP